MFWNKKKEEKVEEINFMYCRLMNLTYKLRAILYNGDYNNPELSVYWGSNEYHLIVETALGKRYFDLSFPIIPNSIPQYNLKMKEESFEWYGYPYIIVPSSINRYKIIFKIVAQEDYLKVEPQMEPNKLTAHDIDMAIYELEQIVQKHYNICKQNKKFHENETEKLMERGN